MLMEDKLILANIGKLVVGGVLIMLTLVVVVLLIA